MERDSETSRPPDGIDVLRDLEKPVNPADKLAELRAKNAVMEQHHRSNIALLSAFIENTMYMVVFRGCAPMLFLVFVFVLGFFWALRAYFQ